jgi:hypothetical protein
VSDCANNTTLYVQTIEVEDTTAPAIDMVAMDATVECDGAGNAGDLTAWLESNGGATATDACGGVMWTNDFGTLSNDCGASGAATVTFTATDDCGNATSTTATFTIEDTTAPVFTVVPSDQTSQCGEQPYTSAATDNCGSVTITESREEISNDACGNYEHLVTLTATDECGNSTDYQFTIVVADTEAPVFVEALPGDLTGIECDAIPMADVLTATDNCDEVDVLYAEEQTNTVCETSYTLVRTWTVSDCSGNTSQHVQTIEVVDTTAPVFENHSEFTMASCSDLIDAEDPAQVPLVATDNCGAVSYSINALLFSGGCPGTWMREWTATDACGNSTTTLQFVTMYDEEAPEWTSLPDESVEISAGMDCAPDTSPAATGVPEAADNCGPNVELIVDYVDSDLLETCPGTYSFTRTWTATDFCGNENSFTQNISVGDDAGPVFTMAPEDQTNQCEEQAYTYEAVDNCSDTPTIIYESRDTLSSDGCGNYVHFVTLTAYDVCGNTTEHQFTITVQDTEGPQWNQSIPQDVTVECGMVPEVELITATDNCDGSVDVIYDESLSDTDCPGEYIVTRTWETSDCTGNSTFAMQVITVTDTTAPEFVEDLPVDATVECDAIPEAEMLTAVDLCDANASVEMTEAITDGVCTGTYSITRTWVASDCAGNETIHEQTIEVQDTTSPIIVAASMDATVECDGAGNSGDLAAWLDSNGGATATDACGGVMWTNDFDGLNIACGPTGSSMVTFTATDDCGNATSTTATFTIEDTTAPEVMAAADATVECDGSGNIADLTAWLDSNAGASATDDCSGVTWSNDYQGTVMDCGSTNAVTVMFTATDACGNATSTSATFTVLDTVAPEFTQTPGDQSNECEESAYTATASDACSAASITESREVISEDGCGNYEHLVTLTATDDCGNSADYLFTIIVNDTTAPVIEDSEGVEDGGIVVVCAEDIWGTVVIPDALSLTASDNCAADATVTLTENYVGEYAPADNVANYCLPNSPATMEDGLTCDNFAVHAARLFNFPGDEFYTLAGGLMTNYVDGTGQITMEVVSTENPNAGWTFEIDLNEGLNWQDWIDQPGTQSYKSDCGLGDHTEWMYYILQNSSTATGWGDYAGSELALSHQPSNGFFGFQVGQGANNKNANHGYSGWFYYIGTFEGADVMGTGDVFADIDCSLPWGIEREYTVTDCSGNSSTFSYTVDVNGMTCAPIDPTLDGNDESDNGWGDDAIGDDGIGEDDGSSEGHKVKLLGLTPNPANDIALLTFMSTADDQVGVHLYNSSGMLVMTLWEGQVFADIALTIEVPASTLQSGLYQIQILSANGSSITTKLMVGN